MSRNDVEPADAHARRLGVRIISPDRPGVGSSDRKPGHLLLDWVTDDVSELLDHLDVDRFTVMGWSEGGQYALAVAHALADRVDRAAVIAGCLPLDDPATFAELDTPDKRLAKLTEKHPAFARAYFRMSHAGATHLPARIVEYSTKGLPDAEAEAVCVAGDWMARCLAEGSADPHGATDEYVAFVAPWGFTPEEVTTSVSVFQGDVDGFVPLAWSEELARRLPNASLTVYPGEGHLIGLTRRAEVLTCLLAPT